MSRQGTRRLLPMGDFMKATTVAIAALTALVSAAGADAADLKVLASNGVKGTLEELTPAFERATGEKLTITFGLAAALKRQIEAGEAFDIAILTSAGIEDLARQGRIDGTSRASIARSGVGIGVRAGAPKPDLSSADALRRTLLSAKSIAWEKMGIAEQIQPKLKIAASGAQVGEMIAKGEVELGALLVNELLAIKGVEVAGPLPAELQSYTIFHAGVSAASKNAIGAKALIRFLTTPDAAGVFRSKGQEPG